MILNCPFSVIAKSFTLVDIYKNGCQISPLTTIHLKRKCLGERFGIHFLRCQPNWKKLSEIKPPSNNQQIWISNKNILYFVGSVLSNKNSCKTNLFNVCMLKVSYFRKFSFASRNEQKYFCISALVSKKRSNQ